MAQTLRGEANEYLSHIHLWQVKVVLKFLLWPPGSILRAGSSIWKAGVEFVELEGVFEITWRYGF